MQLGLITIGQGPRDDLTEYHRRLFQRDHRNVNILVRNVFDELSLEEARLLQARENGHSVVAPFRSPQRKGHRLGDGWEGLTLAASHYPSRIETCIAELETEGAQMILLACAAEFPGPRIRSRQPFLQPRALLIDLLRSLARTSPRPLRVGVVVMKAHWATDRQDWTSSLAGENVESTFIMADGPIGEIAAIPTKRFDLVCVLAYGFGCATDDEPVLRQLEERFHAPVLLPAEVSAAFISQLTCRSPAQIEDRN